MKASVNRSGDLLVDDEQVPTRRLVDRGAIARPGPLQDFVSALAGTMLSQSAPAMASFIGGKVFQRLERVGRIRMDEAPLARSPAGLEAAVKRSIATGAAQSQIAIAIGRLAESISWRRGRSGPFASVNFDKSHAHGIVVGVGGVEDRSDVRLGVTFMEPYSRFPDHVQLFSRAFLLLSSSEICIDGRNWFHVSAGTVFANEAGQPFAMRCTSTPLLAVWCHIEDDGR